jgi:ArsR family transcriptional regulator
MEGIMESPKPNRVDEMEADIFRALGHPIRVQIVKFLEKGERTVSEIVPGGGAEQSNVSRHLAILRQSGVLMSRKEGLKVYYNVRSAEFPKMIVCVGNCVQNLMRERKQIDESTLSEAEEEVSPPAAAAGTE